MFHFLTARKKSLKIIKNQSERLSRMVEDLLVIPDIESATLRMNYGEVNLKNVMETSILSTTREDISIFKMDLVFTFLRNSLFLLLF